MAAAQLLLTAAASLASAALFGALALSLRRRYGDGLPASLRWPARAFVVWWAMLSLQALDDAARFLLGLSASPDATAYVWLARIKIVAAGAAIWGLGVYVIYLYRGRRWVTYPVLAVAAAHAGFFLWALQHRLPARIDVGTWAPRLVLEGPTVGGSLGVFFLFLFFIPPMVLAVAYVALVRRLEDRTQRVRVGAIAFVIVVYQAIATVQFNPDTSADSPAFGVMSILGALAALVAFLTYHPPRGLARRWGIRSVRDAPAVTA